jgi:rhamnosyl/mannosyltransferase
MRTVEATLLIVGEGGKGADLRSAAELKGVASRVVFCGAPSNDDRAAYYHAADVCVLPSTGRSESFGIVLLEAMASGTPVVSTEIGSGTSWVNADGSTGLVVPPSDPAALAAALRTILSDAPLRARMGQAARKRVAECFTMTKMLDRIGSIYRAAAGDAA